MVERLRTACRDELDAYDQASDAQEDATPAQKQFNWPENVRKPADLYRSYASPLRKAKQLGYPVTSLLRELMLIQNRPLDELDSPGWIDPYTGEVDPESDLITIRRLTEFPAPETLEGDPNEIVSSITYYENGVKVVQPITRAQHAELIAVERRSVAASEGFNSEDGEEEEWFDDVDPLKPMWQQINEELNPQNLPELSREARPYQADMRKAIDLALMEAKAKAAELLVLEVSTDPAFEQVEPERLKIACEDVLNFPNVQCRELEQLSRGIWRAHQNHARSLRDSTFSHARSLFRESAGGESLPRMAAAQGRRAGIRGRSGSPVPLLPARARVRGGGCGADRCWSGSYPHLYDFIEENFDEISEMLLDGALGQGTSVSQAELDAFADETIEQIAALQGDPNSKEITHHPAYIKGYLTAMANAKEITGTDENGNYHNAAIEAGWDAWRQWKSPGGNQAYHEAKANGKTTSEAMKAFWQVVNKPKIVGIRKDGLTLMSGDKNAGRSTGTSPS